MCLLYMITPVLPPYASTLASPLAMFHPRSFASFGCSGKVELREEGEEFEKYAAEIQ